MPRLDVAVSRHCRARRATRVAAGAFVALAAIFLGATPRAWAAGADALKVQFSTRVPAGTRPKITLTATQAVGPLEVSLRDDAGKSFSAHIPRLPAGARHEVPLDDAPGRHRYQGTITIGGPDGSVEERPLTFETVVAANLQVTIDRARVDLAARRLEARLSRPADRVEVQVQRAIAANDTNAEADVEAKMVRAEQNLGGAPADTPLVITWPAFPGARANPGAAAASSAANPSADADVARIDLRFFDTDGFFTSVALLPWRIFIPHEEVTFATNSDAIDPAERPKLEASFAKIAAAVAQHRALGAVKLYIAGHTDTVGTPAHNLTLSRARALSIARWFRQRGVRLPIAYEGFGEHALAVATADETPEGRNRRADYILALEDPVLGGGRVRVTWKLVPGK